MDIKTLIQVPGINGFLDISNLFGNLPPVVVPGTRVIAENGQAFYVISISVKPQENTIRLVVSQ